MRTSDSVDRVMLAGPREAVAHALERGTAYLLRQRHGDGWWRDFDTLAGSSDEWVTVYVGCALSLHPDASAREAAHGAWR